MAQAVLLLWLSHCQARVSATSRRDQQAVLYSLRQTVSIMYEGQRACLGTRAISQQHANVLTSGSREVDCTVL